MLELSPATTAEVLLVLLLPFTPFSLFSQSTLKKGLLPSPLSQLRDTDSDVTKTIVKSRMTCGPVCVRKRVRVRVRVRVRERENL